MSDAKCSETILLVEDELLVREVAVTILRDRGYCVLEAESGKEALQIVENLDGQTIHLLLTDIVMPGMKGTELAEKVAIRHPESKILYTSGYTADTAIKQELSRPGVAFLQKPFTPLTLVERVRAILDGE